MRGNRVLTDQLTSWSRIILEKLIVTQLANNHPPLMEPEGSLPCSQGPAISPYPEPDESSLHLPTLIHKIYADVSFHLRMGLPSGHFPSGFPAKFLYAFLISHVHVHTPPISSSSISLP